VGSRIKDGGDATGATGHATGATDHATGVTGHATGAQATCNRPSSRCNTVWYGGCRKCDTSALLVTSCSSRPVRHIPRPRHHVRTRPLSWHVPTRRRVTRSWRGSCQPATQRVLAAGWRQLPPVAPSTRRVAGLLLRRPSGQGALACVASTA
jgi:hypothetical protein